MTSGELSLVQTNINSKNEARIRQAITKVQEAARDYLNDAHSKFIKYLQK
jgi:hypothetical protein